MGGSAVLGSNLVDSLVVDVVDSLRDELHTEMGVRQYRVFLVKRKWSGTTRGEGSIVTRTETEITPQPLVDDGRGDGLRYKLEAAGMSEEGEILLTEVSLTYTEDELKGNPVAADEDFYYELRDAHGQSISEKRFVLAADPETDRIETIGWKIRLRVADGLGNGDCPACL